MEDGIISRVLQFFFWPLFAVLSWLRLPTFLKQAAHYDEGSTIDEDQVSFFSKLSSEWWDEKGKMRNLHCYNELRVPLIVEGLLEVGQIDLAKSQSPLPLQGLKIIDIGCAAGILTEIASRGAARATLRWQNDILHSRRFTPRWGRLGEWHKALAKLGAEITGVDASQNMIKVAKIHAEKDSKISNSITYVSETIEEHAKKYPGYYDVIVASEVLEHVNNKELFVHCSAATVKPGGSFFITTPNRTFTVWFGLILISEYISKRIPRGTHYMHMMYTPEETRSLLKKNDCSIIRTRGIRMSTFGSEWYWSTNTDMFYAVHAVRNNE
ncbi:ubiquinone biosynthesis O-methyltransferase-like isoform X1 [Periplaneta americana]|uniref:ubiquinone biosynthesis O-methyltransferase-like isoform X1 n=1 Tax=Periplaneta americana TaxID=6978 RepID=UPI0037E7D37F